MTKKTVLFLTSLVLVFSIFLPAFPFISYAAPDDELTFETEQKLSPELDWKNPDKVKPEEKTSSQSFELIIDQNVPDQYRNQLQQEFKRVYPLLVNKWNPQAPKKVYLKNGKLGEDILGQAQGNEVTLDFQKEQNLQLLNQENYWVFIHELAHVTTWHLAGAPWLLEGMADYSVILFGEPKSKHRDLQPPKPHETVETLKEQKYRVAARFLIWLKDQQKETIIEEINQAGFAITEKVDQEFNQILNEEEKARYYSRYEEELDIKLKELTGKTLEELWADYVQNPGNYEQSLNCLAGDRNCTNTNPVSNPERKTQTTVDNDNQQVRIQQSVNQRSNEVESVNRNIDPQDVRKIPSSLILKMISGEQ